MAKELSALVIQVYSESQVNVKQVCREYEACDEHTISYREVAQRLTKLFNRMEFKRLQRSDNNHRDPLARLVSTLSAQDSRMVPVEYL